MTAQCGVAELLRAGGPVRVPLRACCAAALVGRKSPADGCAVAAELQPDDAIRLLDPTGLLDTSGAGK